MHFWLKLFYCPRISLMYFFLGVPFGAYIGYLCFHTKQPGLTCLVIQQSSSLSNINATKSTWLPKCDHQIIVKYHRPNKRMDRLPQLPECKSDVTEILSDSSWGAFCQALLLVPDRSTNWLLITPETTMVFVENLRKYVERRDWRKLIYAGHPVNNYLAVYNALSAGIVMSYELLRKFRQRFPDRKSCERDGRFWSNEDIILGVQARKLGASVEDTRDAKGRSRFHGFNINTLLNPGPTFRRSDYYKKSTFPFIEGRDCCSNEMITIKASDADQAMWQYFLTYRVGAITNDNPSSVAENPLSPPSWESALREIGYKGPTHNITAQQYYDIWKRHISPDELVEKIANIVAH